MKIGILTTVHVAGNREALGLLRLLVDSIRLHVPRQEYEVFLIADDCSPPWAPLDSYYDGLTRAGVAVVYRMGSAADPHWVVRHGGTPKHDRAAHGHAVGLMAGFGALRALGCTHAWVIDGDCVLVK